MIYNFDTEQLSPATLRYQQVFGNDTTYLTAGDVSAMSLFVYDTDTTLATTPSGGVSLSPSNCITTLQPWGQDGIGYNVAVSVDGSYLPLGNKIYRVEVKVTPVNGEAFYLQHSEATTTPTLSAGD